MTAEYLTAHAVFHRWPVTARSRCCASSATGWMPSASAQLSAAPNSYARGVPAPHTYTRMFDGDRITIGGRLWQIRVGYGHSPEHASLYCADAGVLISGDMLLPKNFDKYQRLRSNPRCGFSRAIPRFPGSIPRVAGRDARAPSHGLPFIGIHNRVAAQHAHHEERLRVLEDACTEPRSAADLLATLFPRELDTHQVMFAMGGDRPSQPS